MARGKRSIIGGVDTHAATRHAAVINLYGRPIADAEFPARRRDSRFERIAGACVDVRR